MPVDLESIYNEIETEGSQLLEDGNPVDEPDAESADVIEGETDELVSDDGNPEEVEDLGTEGETASWDWSEYSDRMVPIKVDGEETLVPLKELRDGYMRQADYTRKTQSLSDLERTAQWGQDVQRAFDQDPMGTLEAFARAYGLLDQQPQQDGPNLDEIDEDIRPWAEKATAAERQLAQMQQRLEQLEMERLKSDVMSEVNALKSRFGDTFDSVEVLRNAAAKNMSLEDSYWNLMGQRSYQQQQNISQSDAAAARAAEEQRKADSERKQTQKRQASSTQTGSYRADDVPVDDFNTITELYEKLLASS